MPTTVLRTPRTPVLLAAGAVLLQVAYPLVHGSARDGLTVATVLSFFAASTAHAVATRGAAWAARFLVGCLGVALGAEALGVATGFPFGSYAYGDTLGPEVLAVPLVVPLAWAMIGYPCLLVGQRLATGWRSVGVAAWALAS